MCVRYMDYNRVVLIITRAAIDMNPKIRTTGKHNYKVTKNEI